MKRSSRINSLGCLFATMRRQVSSSAWARLVPMGVVSAIVLGAVWVALLPAPALFAQATPDPGSGMPNDGSAAEDASRDGVDSTVSPAPLSAVRPVVVLTLDDAIHPLAAEYVEEGVAKAKATNAAALVIELSTPGGLVTSTRKITSTILQSPVPVVVFVGPRGAQAASAGFYILMSADIAAMAPGTNTGAAHPVAGGGQDIEGDLGTKVEQDAAANIRSLAGQHGRNLELAEAAVLESRSFTAQEALDQGLIEVMAPDVPSLLEAIDGRTVAKAGSEPVVLSTATALIDRVEMGPIARFLAVISNPQIALLLISFGTLGLYIEISNPGLIFPGVIGAIFLILGFYTMSVLPLDYAGMALIVLALILFAAEFIVPSFGIFTVGGAVSLVLGAVMVFRSPDPALQVDLGLILGVTGSIVLIIGLLMSRVILARNAPVVTGVEGLTREVGTARTDLDPQGKVFVHGELWNARARQPVAAGDRVQVVSVEGLTLEVRPVEDHVASEQAIPT